uniref:Uncharacterized protein n=1 Tax=Panagrolaimus sp. ES5 TaxID=591445 RepID=A0AC34FL76_9BILA
MTKVINEDCRLDVSHSGYSRHNHSRGYGARRDYDDENYPRLGYRGYANQVSTRGRYGGGGYGQRSSDAW